jgi:CxxC-x17-CxxC domain-containing protein
VPNGLEKYSIVCSLCGKEKTVPFKPEPGRPVYCKECIAKIKSGEVKVEKGGQDQIKYDEATFYKPLADLGIEFGPDKGNKGNGGKNKNGDNKKNEKENNSLKEVLNQIKREDKVEDSDTKEKDKEIEARKIVNEEIQKLVEDKVPEKKVLNISTKTIKQKIQDIAPKKDRAASKEDMEKLKALLSTVNLKEEKKVEPEIVKDLKVEKEEQKAKEEAKDKEDKEETTPEENTSKLKVREIPEDVLRKILEE